LGGTAVPEPCGGISGRSSFEATGEASPTAGESIATSTEGGVWIPTPVHPTRGKMKLQITKRVVLMENPALVEVELGYRAVTVPIHQPTILDGSQL